MMAGFELSGHDWYRIEKARTELAAAKQLDLSDDRALVRMLARLEVAVGQLLDVVDEHMAGEQS